MFIDDRKFLQLVLRTINIICIYKIFLKNYIILNWKFINLILMNMIRGSSSSIDWISIYPYFQNKYNFMIIDNLWSHLSMSH